MIYDKERIEQLLEGYWYREPKEEWYVDNIDINKQQMMKYCQKGYKTLFIAMDSETWHKGSGNTGIYAGWEDTHKNLEEYKYFMSGVIASRPIEYLDEDIPQFIMKDTYSAIKKLGEFSFSLFKGKMIGITGTAGKSTCKTLLNELLEVNHTVNSTRGNHNTRTGVPLTVANAINNPDYLVLEMAISSLWMKSGGIAKTYIPDLALITSIDGGQNKTPYETAILKSKIAEGMHHNGKVILNRDMNEYFTVKSTIEKYNKNIVTYGFNNESDSIIERFEEYKDYTHVEASILGEPVSFNTFLSGKAMIENIIGVLTIIKLLDIPLESIMYKLENYQPNNGVQNFEHYKKNNGVTYTLINDSWNAMGISMLEGIKVLKTKSRFYKGKTIAILGRIIGLDKNEKEAKRQHELIAEELINSNIDLVYGHGKEMKYTMKKLPKHMIGGYYERAELLAYEVANIIEDDDLILIKGSVRNSNFKNVKKHLILYANSNTTHKVNAHKVPSKGYGVATFSVKTNKKVSYIGNQDVIQNQGLGGILIIHHILDLIFSKRLSLSDVYKPDKQAIKESKNPRSIPLNKKDEITLNQLLTSAIVTSSPNAILMLANTVIGSNNDSLKYIKETIKEIGANPRSALNITGRRISNKIQELSLNDLYLASKLLFNKYPFIKDILTKNNYVFKDKFYKSESNLFNYGIITHGFFYGQDHSIGTVLSKINGEEYITVVLGAKDAFHRDELIYNSIMHVTQGKSKHTKHDSIRKKRKSPFEMNIIGDTYFGEYYTKKRQAKDIDDALTSKGRHYSFDGIRDFLKTGDFNICNFEAAISDDDNAYLKQRKPYVLHASEEETARALKKEYIHLATLANNHLMDCNIEGLNRTIKQFEAENIYTIGAGNTQEEAEKPFVLNYNGQKYTIFNAYWYRRPMYREYDFYAIGNKPGVACINPSLYKQISKVKEEGAKVIVIAHWGVDFGKVQIKQREYAQLLEEAGADLIIGHGAHMMQSIEKINRTTVVYSIGNGIFNSNGEYDQRFVPPYSFIARLTITPENDLSLKLYPIYSNNKETFWQPRFLTEDEFKHCSQMLKQYGSIETIKTGYDQHYYYDIPL